MLAVPKLMLRVCRPSGLASLRALRATALLCSLQGSATVSRAPEGGVIDRTSAAELAAPVSQPCQLSSSVAQAKSSETQTEVARLRVQVVQLQNALAEEQHRRRLLDQPQVTASGVAQPSSLQVRGCCLGVGRPSTMLCMLRGPCRFHLEVLSYGHYRRCSRTT